MLEQAWVVPLISGVGAGIDSFYEYALKSYILLGEPDYLDVWHESYAAVMKHIRGREGFWVSLTGASHVQALMAPVPEYVDGFWSNRVRLCRLALRVLAGSASAGRRCTGGDQISFSL
jgi:hypothetical protein